MLGMIAFSCAISVGLIWAINALARSPSWGSAGACLFAAVATVPFLCFSPALALQSALTCLFLLLVRIGFRGNIRQYSLRNLHDSISDEFVMARGFGPVRMAGVQAERVKLPNSPPIPLPSAQSPEVDYDFEHGSAASVVDQAALNSIPPRNDLLAIHDSGVEDFLESERMGFAKDRDHVAGFVSHRFTRMPRLAVPKDQSPASWKIVRLELVSLLKHDTPVAYLSKNLPRMDELRDAPTRPLEPFEQRSLDRLRSEEDVLLDETPDRIRMVGSLRASKTCLECHSVRRGELLGALTYELVPAKSTRKKSVPVSTPSS